MHFSAIIPILLSAAAFVLSVHVLLAGNNPNLLTDVYVIKLDTHNIANGTVNVPQTGSSSFDGITVKSIVKSAANKLGIHDFYTAEVMGYCEGLLENTGSGNATRQVVTNCTSRPMYIFDPVPILEQELNKTGTGITLKDIGFPAQDVQNAVNALNIAYKTMFVAYVVGIVAAGICFFLGFLGCFTIPLVTCVNWMFAFLSFLGLGIASAIGTAIAIKLREIINDKLASILVTASYSTKYLGMTWAAVAAMFIVSLYWCGACFSSRKSRVHNKR